MAQHDVDILDDHRISVFDNRAYYRGTYWARRRRLRYDRLRFRHADASRGPTTTPLRDGEAAKVLFEGLYAGFRTAHTFVIEDQTAGLGTCSLRQTAGRLAQFVNRHDDGKVYQIGWGRYVDQTFGDSILNEIEGIDCDG